MGKKVEKRLHKLEYELDMLYQYVLSHSHDQPSSPMEMYATESEWDWTENIESEADRAEAQEEPEPEMAVSDNDYGLDRAKLQDIAKDRLIEQLQQSHIGLLQIVEQIKADYQQREVEHRREVEGLQTRLRALTESVKEQQNNDTENEDRAIAEAEAHALAELGIA